jgi:gluconokinase
MLSYDAPMAANNGTRDAPSSLPNNVSGPKGVSASDASRHHADSSSYKHHHIWLVTGPAGCGKSTVAEHLAKELNVPYVEGDSV